MFSGTGGAQKNGSPYLKGVPLTGPGKAGLVWWILQETNIVVDISKLLEAKKKFLLIETWSSREAS